MLRGRMVRGYESWRREKRLFFPIVMENWVISMAVGVVYFSSSIDEESNLYGVIMSFSH